MTHKLWLIIKANWHLLYSIHNNPSLRLNRKHFLDNQTKIKIKKEIMNDQELFSCCRNRNRRSSKIENEKVSQHESSLNHETIFTEKSTVLQVRVGKPSEKSSIPDGFSDGFPDGFLTLLQVATYWYCIYLNKKMTNTN